MADNNTKPWWIRSSLREVASFFNLAPSTVRNWRTDGMPGERRSWDVAAIFQWAIKNNRIGPSPVSDDPMLVGDSESEGLERYRLARAQREEIKLAEECGQIILKDKFDECGRVIMSPLRQLQETLKRKQDHDTLQMVHETIAEMERGLAALENTEKKAQ